MSTWDGWDSQLLTAIGAPDVGVNRLFLDQWAKADGTHCARNPLAATVPISGSSHCQHVSGNSYVQAYTTHAHAIAATAKQLEQAPYASILAALKSGEPFTYKDWQIVVGALGTWGAHKYAVQYAKEAGQATGGGDTGGGAPSDAHRSLTGYHHFAQTLSRTVPTELRKAQRLRAKALAHLRH